MKPDCLAFHHCALPLMGLVASLGWIGLCGETARAEDAPALATNSIVATNNEEADKAWQKVSRAGQSPMPPAQWAGQQPSREELAKFYLSNLLGAADLAKDFYTKYPTHPKAADAQKEEYEMLAIAAQQFGDTNHATRLQALETKRASDPTVSEDERLQMRLMPVDRLMHDLPESLPELQKTARALQKDFPKREEVYRVMLMVLSRSEGEQAEAFAKEIGESAAPPEIKEQVKFILRLGPLNKLIAGLPETRDELEKSARAFHQELPQRPEYYQVMLVLLRQSEGAKAEALAKEIEEGPAPEEIKIQAKVELRLGAMEKLIAGLPETRDELEQGARALLKDFPGSPEAYRLMLTVLMQSKGEKAQSLAKEIMDGPAPEQIKAGVQGMLKRLDAIGKPMNLQYTAVDGREVDLGKMKGKVVLVDFWATWCAPCMAEMPHVKSAYKKFHEKGFEIVGISFDQSKEALAKTLKLKEMTWPQYFDGAGWQNKYAQEFAITSIPAMWLVDKQGNLRDVDAAGGLESKVAKLLAEE